MKTDARISEVNILHYRIEFSRKAVNWTVYWNYRWRFKPWTSYYLSHESFFGKLVLFALFANSSLKYYCIIIISAYLTSISRYGKWWLGWWWIMHTYVMQYASPWKDPSCSKRSGNNSAPREFHFTAIYSRFTDNEAFLNLNASDVFSINCFRTVQLVNNVVPTIKFTELAWGVKQHCSASYCLSNINSQ